MSALFPKFSPYDILDPYSDKPLFKLPSHFGKCLENAPPSKSSLNLSGALKQKVQRDSRDVLLLSHIQSHLPQEGVLSVDSRGFIYLKISDAYIYELFPLLNEEEATLPPYFEGIFSEGAHISCILPYENRKLALLPELGKTLPFEVTGCFSLTPPFSPIWQKVYFLTVEAPALEEVRMKLGLNPKIEGSEFHITLAVKKQFLAFSDIVGEGDQEIKTGMKALLQKKIDQLKGNRDLQE